MWGWCSENGVSCLSWEHETPPVTNLLICDTRQVLLECDFSSTNKVKKIEMTKAPGGTGTPHDKPPCQLEQLDKWSAACDFLSWNLSLFGRQRPEKIFSLATEQVLRKWNKKKGKTSSSFYIWDILEKQKSLSKQALLWWELGAYQSVSSL